MANNKEITNKIKNFIDDNNLNELICYVNNNNIELKNLNSRYFDIISYTYSLYDKNIITSRLKDFIVHHYDNKIVKVTDILNDNNLDELKKYVSENNIIFKELNYKHFNILEYTEYLYKKEIISSEVKEYVLNHYNDYKKREKVIEIIKTNNVNELKKYVESNRIEFKQLNDDYFDISEFVSSPKNNISHKMKLFVILHLDHKREKILELLKKNSINALKRYLEKNDIELRDLDDKYFSIVSYVNSTVDYLYSDIMKNFVVSHYDKKRYQVIELIRNDYISQLKRYIDFENIELESLNDENFNLIEYINSPQNYISSRMKYFVLSHYNYKRYKIVELIRNDSISQLRDYIKKNDINLEDLNDSHFNLLKYVYLESNDFSMNMRVFVLGHLNKKRYDIVERIREDDYKSFKNYIEKNDIELKNYNDDYFDIIRYSCSLYNRGVISCKMKNYIIEAFDKKRRETIEIIKKNDLNELKNYIIKHDIELDKLNGTNFDIISYTCSYLYNISTEIKKFIKKYHNKKGSLILMTQIKENKVNELKSFVDKTNFSFKSLNNDKFDILDYSMNLYHSGTISLEMKDFIICHYNQKRNEIIKLINKNDLEELNKYIKTNTIIFEELNDKYFNIKDLSDELLNKRIISSEMKLLILSHYTKPRSDIINILHNNNIEELKTYIDVNNIEIKNLNNEDFNIIKYSIIYIKDISSGIIDYLLCHFNRKRGTIVDLIKSNDINKIKQFLEKNNIKLNDINDDLFEITKYTNSLYNKNQISNKVKNYIETYFKN